ncbi:MAG: DUF971 domain-containing protein [Gammaproteobacteria bacterium]|nr:DUF971 domain-containing protein [Gammaproteobacteria bacterium]
MAQHQPTDLLLHQATRVLEVSFADGATFRLSCEYLRVYSPSAEVRGHGPGQGVLQIGKEKVNITDIEPVGNYAVRLVFDDGHNTGLYTWDYLYQLGKQFAANWLTYTTALVEAGHPRQAPADA